MQLELADKVRLEVGPEGTRMVVRIFLGDRELPATQALIGAISKLAVGDRRLPFQALMEQGVLVERDRRPESSSTLALRPTTQIGVRLQPGDAQIVTAGRTRTVSVLPDNSLPIGGFVPPAVLGPLQHLATELRDGWFHMLRAACSRGILPDPDHTRELLLGLIAQRISEDPGLAELIELTPAGVQARKPLQQETFAYPISQIDLIDDREPTLATDRLRFAIQPPEIASLGRLLGAYGHGADAPAAREAIADSPRLVALAGGLVGTPMLGAPPRTVTVEPGCVAHLGHATLLANLGGHHVLIDPWFPAASREDSSPPLSIAQLPKLAGVFFTHHHWDHVNLATLLRIDKSTPMYVPAQPEALLVPKTAAWLRSLGFADVYELAPGESVGLGSLGRVIAAEFTGEDPTDIGWSGNTYVLQHEQKSAWVHVDSGPDRHGSSVVSTGAAAALRAEHGPLNPVFATRRQERGTMVEHSWEFLFADPNSWTRPTENCCNDARFLASLTEAVGGQLVLYSEGGAPWYPHSTDFLRGDQVTAADAVQMYLWDGLDAIREACAVPVETSLPRDVWRIGGGRAEGLSW